MPEHSPTQGVLEQSSTSLPKVVVGVIAGNDVVPRPDHAASGFNIVLSSFDDDDVRWRCDFLDFDIEAR